MPHIESAPAQWDALFAELSDGICVSGSKGEIYYLNRAAERMLEVSFKSVQGQSLCELLCGQLWVGPERCSEACPLRNKTPKAAAVTFQGRHGPKMSFEWKEPHIQRVERWGHLRVRCLQATLDQNRPEKHFTIIEDASAQIELERQKEDWRSMIAHDLRAPLTSVYGTLRILEETMAAQVSPPPAASLIGASLRACRRILELLNLYLDLAKFDAGLMTCEPKSLDLGEVLKECVDEEAALAQEKKIEVAVELGPGLQAQADPELLRRVIQNLVNNALKFTPDGGQVTIFAELPAPGWVSLSVRDTGPGIDPAEFPHLFDRYHQARARREGRIEGTGLGLAFCWEALKAMKGLISVESRPGSGTTFTIRLPAPADGRKP